MHTPVLTDRDTNHRFPAEIISPGVWRYDRCGLSDRDGEARLGVRGVTVSSEASRQWGRTCGHQDAHPRRRRRPSSGDPWHLDAVVLPIPGERHSRWRAGNPAGHGLDLLVQSRRNHKAAKRCFRKRRHGGQSVPRVLITANLASAGAATREILPSLEPRPPRYLNHRAEHAPQPPRQRERRRPGCKSPGYAQRVLAA
jgi:putative transposase